MSWPAFMSELAFVVAMLLLICPLLCIQLRRQPAQQPKPSARVGGSPWN